MATSGSDSTCLGISTNSDGKGSKCDQNSSSPAAESVVVRGPGNGTAGYCLLQSQQLDGSTLENPDPAPAPLAIAAKPHVDVVVSTLQAVPVEVAVNPTSTAKNDAAGDSVAAGSYLLKVTPIGATDPVFTSGSLPDSTGFVPDSTWVDGHGVPNQLTFGWSAATGNSTDYHTIANVNVQTLNGTPPTLGVTLSDDSGGTAHSGQTVNLIFRDHDAHGLRRVAADHVVRHVSDRPRSSDDRVGSQWLDSAVSAGKP